MDLEHEKRLRGEYYPLFAYKANRFSANAGIAVSNDQLWFLLVGLLAGILLTSPLFVLYYRRRLATEVRQLELRRAEYESCLKEARTDAVTRLANRWAFDAEIEERFATYRRDGRKFALAMVDIDHFKPINDGFGHQAGDEVLRHVGRVLHDSFTDAFLVARYGGEEFALILPGGAVSVAERIDRVRRRIAAEEIPTTAGPLRITISVGVSEAGGDAGVAKLIGRADESLYAAKQAGRDRVYLHDGQRPTGARPASRQRTR